MELQSLGKGPYGQGTRKVTGMILDERVQSRRREADAAIQLAMSSRWEEAVAANRAILRMSPNDGDAYNRLGKAMLELGRYPEAKRSYKKALELDIGNKIAKKNLERLNLLAKSNAAQATTSQVDPKLFIEEMGKSIVTVLEQPAKDALTTLNAGDRLELRPRRNRVAVETAGGEAVGVLETKLASRLIKLFKDGNQYAAGVTSLGGDEVRMIIKETYKDPSQAGRPSFPTAVGAEGLRAYTKGSLIQRGTSRADEMEADPAADDDGAEGNAGPDWASERVAQEGTVRLNDAAAAEDADDDDLEE